MQSNTQAPPGREDATEATECCGANHRFISNNPWLECRVSDLYHSHTALEPVGQAGGCWRALGKGLRPEKDSQTASETGA